MDLTELLALPGAPHLRLKVGPLYKDTIDVDRIVLEAKRADLRRWCLSLPHWDGATWEDMKAHADGNSMLSRLLIVLGAEVGAWESLPRDGGPWSPLGPEIRVSPAKPDRPSNGLLDPVGHCASCGRPYGEEGSAYHDLHKSRESDLCELCDPARGGATGKSSPSKTRAKRRAPTPPKGVDGEYVSTPPAGLDAYLKSFL